MLLLSYSACNAQFQRSCGSENYPHSLTFFTVTFPFTQYLQAKTEPIPRDKKRSPLKWIHFSWTQWEFLKNCRVVSHCQYVKALTHSLQTVVFSRRSSYQISQQSNLKLCTIICFCFLWFFLLLMGTENIYIIFFSPSVCVLCPQLTISVLECLECKERWYKDIVAKEDML